jgi:hypothetical protein
VTWLQCEIWRGSGLLTLTQPWPRAPEGVDQDIEAPVAEQATVGPLTGDPAIVGVLASGGTRRY